MKPTHCRALSLFAATCFSVAAFAQPAPKPLAFEVVSIRPSKPGTNRMFSWVTTPDGYRVSGQSLADTILMAYYPQGWMYWRGRLQSAPGWTNDLYDIDAKVSETDLTAWQKQGLMLDQKPMLREMLQTMLADRCKLSFHRVPSQIAGFSLEIGKHAPHLSESKPGESIPEGMKYADGGVSVPYKRGEEPHTTFYNASISDLAQFLSMVSAGHPVENHTNLSGHYDFVLNWGNDPDSKLPPGIVSSDDPSPVSHWDVNGLGFHLVPAKIPIDDLVIDHIEKPSAN